MVRIASTTVALALLGPFALASDGVMEINQTCAAGPGCFPGGSPGFPVTLTSPGSYRLTGNLNSESIQTISLQANQVTLDLNGFMISGGNTIRGDGSDATVRNGSIGGSIGFESGIFLTGERNVLQSLRFTSAADGLELGNSCVVRDVEGTLLYPLLTGRNCVIVDSVLTNRGNGSVIVSGAGTRIEGCVLEALFDGGVSVSDGAVILGNRIKSGYTAVSASNAVIKGNTIESSDWKGIAGSKNIIEGNVVKGASSGGPDVGIECVDCTVIGNVVRDSGLFGLLDPSGSTGYANNQFINNNGGNANPQVSGGIEMGTNICGGDTTCP